MELFTSVWVIFFIYCTEWLGIQQCFAVPLPTLTNYHHGYYSKNSWNNRQTRYPETKYEKFVFPTKQQEIIPFVAERSGFEDDNSGKIFFPDDIPPRANEKQSEDREVFPVWKIHHRPTTAVSSSHSGWQSIDGMKSMHTSQDGSIQMPSSYPKQQLHISDTTLETIDRSSYAKDPTHSYSPGSGSKVSEEERIQEAIQEFYKWVKLTRARQKIQQKETIKCPEQFPTGNSNTSGTNANTNPDANKPGAVISDQSLVAGLKDQKCPEGQIRLENGECRVKVAI